MEVLSTAWRTDLALLTASGSTVEDHGGYVVVRTPDNPAFWWGNFLLLRRIPMRRDIDGWRQMFENELPALAHCALGIDDPDVRTEDLRAFADAGFETDVATVLTATAVQAPLRTTPGVRVRQLAGDADWAQRLTLSQRLFGGGSSPSYSEFARRRVAAERSLAESGRGAWFGAFEEGRMVSGLGIFATDDAIGRFQSVETHPEHRRRGLATMLVYTAACFALEELELSKLVIVSASEGVARHVYESVGFRPTECQAQAWIAPRS